MTRMLALWVFSALMLTACEGEKVADVRPPEWTVGQYVPDIELPDLDGGHTALRDYRGRTVVLNVWGTWCPPCRAELLSLERLHRQLDPRAYAVLGLAADTDRDVVREYLYDKGVSFARHIDVDYRIVRDTLGVRVYPTTYVITGQGRVAAVVVGPRAWDSPALVAAITAAGRGQVSDFGAASLPGE